MREIYIFEKRKESHNPKRGEWVNKGKSSRKMRMIPRAQCRKRCNAHSRAAPREEGDQKTM